MIRSASAAGIAAVCVCVVCGGTVRAGAAEGVEVGRHVALIQGFEGPDVLAKKPNVSYLSGVPEEAEVEVWDNAPYNRRKIPHGESGIACRISAAKTTQGKSALAATFARDDRVLRVSLRNNINQPDGAGRPACNSIGCFDFLRGDIFNPGSAPVAVEMRMLGGFAVTDGASTFSRVWKLKLAPGWNTFAVSSAEASAVFVDPHDATCVEFRVPGRKGAALVFDNFRMERDTIGKNLARHARCFDFGVPHFNWPGFAYGSVKYDEARGYGFTKGDRLTHGGDLHVINDQLTRDGFMAPASFRVKLPAGRYKVVAQTGNYWARRDGGLNIEIQAEGKRVYYRRRLSGKDFTLRKLAHEFSDHWKRDLDLWETYEAETRLRGPLAHEDSTYFRTVRFEVEVADGALDLDFLLPPVEDGRPHGWSVWTYLIVYPAEKEQLIAPELEWLNEKIRTIYNTVSHVPISRQFALYNREEVICAEEFLWPDIAEARRRALRPSPAEAARGYVHFLRHPHDPVTPDSVPLPNETADELALFAARGQTLHWAAGVYPLQTVTGPQVQVADFTDAAGKVVIPAGKVDVRLVSYRPMTPVTSNHAECFHYIGPGVLIRQEPTLTPEGFPRRFWMTMEVPEDAPPGVLRSKVLIKAHRFKPDAEGGEGSPAETEKVTSVVDVALRVLPFRLAEPEDVTFAVDYRGTMSFRPEDGPAELAFFRRLGMNTVWCRGDRRQLQAMRRSARQAGMELEPGDPDKYRNWRWPRDYRLAQYRRFLDKPGVSFQPRHTGYRQGRKTRFTHGFWLWRSGIRHRVIQTQPNAAERVYYAHYGHAKFGPCSYLFPSLFPAGQPGPQSSRPSAVAIADRFNPAPTLYEVADGITDWRYIQTLEGLVKAAEAAGKKSEALDEAKAYLAELSESLVANLEHYYFERKRNFNHVGRFGLHDTVWRGRRYQMARWELARHIAAVKGAPLAAKAAPRRPGDRRKVILHKEQFGPFWVDPSQFRHLSEQRDGRPRLQDEMPRTPAGRNWATVLVKMDHPSGSEWIAVLKDAAGRQVASERVGVLKRWKSRWVLNTAHLPAGRYTLEVVLAPAGRDLAMTADMRAQITVVAALE